MIRKFIVLLIAWILIHSAIVNAQELPEIPSGLIDHAIGQYNSGHAQSAVQEFSRVLLFDFNNNIAKEYLHKLAHRDDLNVEDKISLIVWEDLSGWVENYNKKVQLLIAENNLIKDSLLKGGIESSLIEQRLGDSRNVAIDQEDLKIEKNKQVSGKNILEEINKMLIMEKQKLGKELDAFQIQNKALKEICLTYGVSIEENRLETAENEADNSLGYLGFKNELTLIREDLKDLRRYVQQQDVKIVNLTQQLVDSTLRISETDLVLDKKNKDIAILNQKIVDLQGRIDLTQKMMGEKDSQMTQLFEEKKSLETSIKKQFQYFNETVAVKDDQLVELSGFLEIYRGKLRDAVLELKTQRAGVDTLEQQLETLRQINPSRVVQWGFVPPDQ